MRILHLNIFSILLILPLLIFHRALDYPEFSQTTREGISSQPRLFLPFLLSGNSVAAPLEITRQINAPYFGDEFVSWSNMAVAWFGKVNPTENYADIRTGYNNDELSVHLNIFDRQLWYDTHPSPSNLTDYDAVSLYLDLQKDNNSTLGLQSFRFDGQMNWWEDDQDWQAAYRADGSSWVAYPQPFTATTGLRGDAPNNSGDDRGWLINFRIPFSSLGLSNPPELGVSWRMAVVMYDRDAMDNGPTMIKTWPENVELSNPSSWGLVSFGLPVYVPPSVVNPGGALTIRQGLNGAQVIDAHVGGHTTCGEDFYPDFFDGWGDANFARHGFINIQNESDVSDWPCFSKFYLTFPLDALPPESQVISATLTLHLFGGSDVTQAQPSWIQVSSVDEAWEESKITWNNAPLALENFGGTWVYPLRTPLVWPGVAYTWDVSQAVSNASNTGQPLRLVLYSADSTYHSGKYFTSSDMGDWDKVGRPTLRIIWGKP